MKVYLLLLFIIVFGCSKKLDVIQKPIIRFEIEGAGLIIPTILYDIDHELILFDSAEIMSNGNITVYFPTTNQ